MSTKSNVSSSPAVGFIIGALCVVMIELATVLALLCVYLASLV